MIPSNKKQQHRVRDASNMCLSVGVDKGLSFNVGITILLTHFHSAMVHIMKF